MYNTLFSNKMNADEVKQYVGLHTYIFINYNELK